MRAGPRLRAGFIDAPVRGPKQRMSVATVKPMPNPPMAAVWTNVATFLVADLNHKRAD